MPNRNLNPEELSKANGLLEEIRTRLRFLSGDDEALLFAYRRKVHKELGYDERGKPMQRRILKLEKRAAQRGVCALCPTVLPDRYAVLDRIEAIGGYTKENTQLICRECDERVQRERKYA